MSTLERAIAIAAGAHAGTIDKAGAPYILHPLRVMLKVASPETQIVAVLHDVVEDGASKGYTFEFIEEQGFSKSVIDGLRAVTKQADEEGKHSEKGYEDTYIRFVLRAAQDPIGRQVKIADLEDNCDLSRIASPTEKDRARLARYRRALELIRSTGK
jgi:(p)ppGpp synthase/HD superfamily hydrolase